MEKLFSTYPSSVTKIRTRDLDLEQARLRFTDLSAVQGQLCEQTLCRNASDRCTLARSSEDLGCSDGQDRGTSGGEKV
jgi:hypothetical protein